MPAYLSRNASSAALVPAQVTRRTRPASSSKSASQIHETSCPSAVRSLRIPSRSSSPCSSVSVRRTSFAPAGFLISRIDSSVPDERDPLGAAECRADRLEPGHDLPELEAELETERRGAERVVDVVEARQRQR